MWDVQECNDRDLYIQYHDDPMTSAVVSEEHPPPTFGSISCVGSKFTGMSNHLGLSFMWSLRSTASSAMRI